MAHKSNGWGRRKVQRLKTHMPFGRPVFDMDRAFRRCRKQDLSLHNMLGGGRMPSSPLQYTPVREKTPPDPDGNESLPHIVALDQPLQGP
jgi:hypothetical protein